MRASDIADIKEALNQIMRLREEQEVRGKAIDNLIVSIEKKCNEAQPVAQMKALKDKKRRLSREPIVNHMTGKTMYPEDCTCNFSGSCLAYCNPYK